MIKRLSFDQALAVASGIGYAVMLPPNAEQQELGVAALVSVKVGHDVLGSYAHSSFEEVRVHDGRVEIVTEVALQYRYHATNDCVGCDKVQWDAQANA